MLFNSEVWHVLSNAKLVKLETVGQSLLRGILNSHSKTPKEFLHLETGTVPIRLIIAQRRLNYLKHITGSHDSELIKRVFIAQKEQPISGDFIKLVENDLKDLGITYDQLIKNTITKEKNQVPCKKSSIYPTGKRAKRT